MISHYCSHEDVRLNLSSSCQSILVRPNSPDDPSMALPIYRGVGDTEVFLFRFIPDNQRLLPARSLGEIIQDKVRYVIKAAEAVMELPSVGMIAQNSDSTFLIS
jgi:hypothetical protein